MKKIIVIFITLFFLAACQSTKDAFTLKKKSSTDEFLVEKKNQVLVIGMGGSILGSKAIYKFLKPKNKKFIFVDNISNTPLHNDNKKKITLIIIIV